MSNEIESLRTANHGLRRKIAELEAQRLAYEAHVLAQYAAYDKNLYNLRTEISRYKAVEAEAALKALDTPSTGEDAKPPTPTVVH